METNGDMKLTESTLRQLIRKTVREMDFKDKESADESIMSQLKKEFKQYEFVQKSQNWKQTGI